MVKMAKMKHWAQQHIQQKNETTSCRKDSRAASHGWKKAYLFGGFSLQVSSSPSEMSADDGEYFERLGCFFGAQLHSVFIFFIYCSLQKASLSKNLICSIFLFCIPGGKLSGRWHWQLDKLWFDSVQNISVAYLVCRTNTLRATALISHWKLSLTWFSPLVEVLVAVIP